MLYGWWEQNSSVTMYFGLCSAFTLLVRWLELYMACNESCLNGSQKFIFRGPSLTWVTPEKWSVKQQLKAVAVVVIFMTEQFHMSQLLGEQILAH